MIDKLTISPATLDDVPQLTLLINSAYRGESSRKGWTTEADLIGGTIRIDEASLADLLKIPRVTILKCHDNETTITGCVYLEKQENKIYLGMLSVSPEAQAGGIGKKLLQAAEDYAKQQGADAIIMHVISVRDKLIEWYERRGYKPNGDTKPFPNDKRFGIPTQPLTFLVLEKTL